MRRAISVPAAILMIALFTAPSALATWRALGTYEPDTTWDQTSGFMWEHPATSGAHAYLNVVPIEDNSWTNPNVGLLGSRVLPANNLRFDAFFGIWRDCNRDGYIGSVETVLMEYPSQLADNTVCPPTPPVQSPGLTDSWNSQGWVSEFRYIGNHNPPGSYRGADGNDADNLPDGRDARNLLDLGAMVWGDFGVPGDTMGREVCPRDLTRGASQRTGAFLNWADCFTGHQGWQHADAPLTILGLEFEDEGNFDEAGHPLNMPTFGKDDGSHAYVHAFDCSKDNQPVATGQKDLRTERQDGQVPDELEATPMSYWFSFTDGEGHLNVSGNHHGNTNGTDHRRAFLLDGFEPTTRTPNTAPSPNLGGGVAGTYNATQDGDCDPNTGSSFYANFEGNALPERADRKNRVTLTFTYFEEQRSGVGKQGQPGAGAPLGAIYPVIRGGDTILWAGSSWYSQRAPSELGSAGPTPPQLMRSDLTPQGPIYWTFYANMTAMTLSKGVQIPGSPGVYGDEWCSRSRDPATNGGFVCDAEQWYVLDDGTKLNVPWSARPGTVYHLRDTDCYDGTIARGVPVHASLVDAAGSACADAS